MVPSFPLNPMMISEKLGVSDFLKIRSKDEYLLSENPSVNGHLHLLEKLIVLEEWDESCTMRDHYLTGF